LSSIWGVRIVVWDWEMERMTQSGKMGIAGGRVVFGWMWVRTRRSRIVVNSEGSVGSVLGM